MLCRSLALLHRHVLKIQLSFCIAVTQMYYALLIINKLLTSVCNKNHCFSSVQEIIYCIVIYFFWRFFFFYHWMGEILENNSVNNKLNLFCSHFCLHICWLPCDCQVRVLWQVWQYYSSLTQCKSISLWQRHLWSKWRRSWIYSSLKVQPSVAEHAGALLHVNKGLWNWFVFGASF